MAHATSSQRPSKRMPPPSACGQRKCRMAWTRSRRARSDLSGTGGGSLTGHLVTQLLIRRTARSWSTIRRPTKGRWRRLRQKLDLLGREFAPVQRFGQFRGVCGLAWPPAKSSLAAPVEEPVNDASQDPAEPCPSLVWRPVSATTGENRAMPEEAARSPSAKSATARRA